MSKLKYKVYNGKSIKELLGNSKLIILSLMFSAGIIIGAISLNNNYISERANNIIDSFILLRSEQGILQVFFSSFLSNFIFLSINIFLAFSLIGYPLVIWIPFFKGIGIGLFCGYLYSVYGFSGFGFSFITIFPGAIVSTFALISACNQSGEYSVKAYLKAIKGKGQFEKGETKYYLLRQFIYILIVAFSSFIDAIFSNFFLRFFEL